VIIFEHAINLSLILHGLVPGTLTAKGNSFSKKIEAMCQSSCISKSSPTHCIQFTPLQNPDRQHIQKYHKEVKD
jgi:hypothetical protein